MTEKELRHLSKTEMLEIMLNQESEVTALKERIQDLDYKLSERSILIQEAGSIAEASLKINKVMEAAQQAADQYLENVRALSEKQCAQREQQEKEYIDALWLSLQKKLDDYYAAKPGIKDAFAADGLRQISAEQLREKKWSEPK